MKTYNLSYERVFSYGISMGAYAALYFGLQNKFAGVIIHDLYELPADYANLHNMTNPNLLEIIDKTKYIPFISMQFNKFEMDKSTAINILNKLKQRIPIFFITRAVESGGHAQCSPSKAYIETTIEYFEKIAPFVRIDCPPPIK